MTLQTINAFILKYHHISRGLLLVALGLLVGLTAWYVEQHVILFGCLGFMVFAVYEGLVHTLSSPIKRDIALDLAKAEAWAKSELGFDPTGVTQPVNSAPPATAPLPTGATPAPTPTPPAA